LSSTTACARALRIIKIMPSTRPWRICSRAASSRLSIGVGDVEHQVKPRVEGDPVDACDDAPVKGFGDIRNHEADGKHLPPGERPRRKVRPVVELARRLQHLFPGRLADARIAVERSGNRGVRNPHRSRDVFDRNHAPRPLEAHVCAERVPAKGGKSSSRAPWASLEASEIQPKVPAGPPQQKGGSSAPAKEPCAASKRWGLRRRRRPVPGRSGQAGARPG